LRSPGTIAFVNESEPPDDQGAGSPPFAGGGAARRKGPGLAKAREGGLVIVRRIAVAKGTDGGWRALFDAADMVSEGAVRDEEAGAVWYGSTSLILPLDEGTSARLREFFVAFAERDMHVRLRALRAALREAVARAPARLGSSACDIRVTSDSRGVRIDVDVQAPLIGRAAAGRR
jgi:hypothetical protein